MDMTPTATAAAPAATTKAAMNMAGGSDCKISLWNWYTIDSCFIARSWHVRSSGMFAGSCVGVVLLVIALEALRRAVKEFDRYLLRKHAKQLQQAVTANTVAVTSGKEESANGSSDKFPAACPAGAVKGYRPNALEQAVRALLHLMQFAAAYFVMLLAMYYNGYIIICIFIGAYVGAYIFHWETIGGSMQTSAAQEATVCCG